MSAPKSLREALAAKRVRTESYPIPIADSETVDQLASALQDARQELTRANMSGDAKRKRSAQAAVDRTKKALDACFWEVRLVGLTDDADFDALVNAFPATEEQIEKAKAEGAEGDDLPTMDLDGFHLALLAACAVDSDLTPEEWREQLWSDRWTRADRKELFERVQLANVREFSLGVPKG